MENHYLPRVLKAAVLESKWDINGHPAWVVTYTDCTTPYEVHEFGQCDTCVQQYGLHTRAKLRAWGWWNDTVHGVLEIQHARL